MKKTLIGFVLFGLFILLSYNISDDSAVKDVVGQVIDGGEQGINSKLVSTGIWLTLTLGGLAIITIVLGGIKSGLKSLN